MREIISATVAGLRGPEGTATPELLSARDEATAAAAAAAIVLDAAGYGRVFGDASMMGQLVGNRVIEIVCPLPFFRRGAVKEVELGFDEPGTGAIIVRAPTASGKYKVIAVQLVTTFAGVRWYDVTPALGEEGSLVSFLGLTGGALRYKQPSDDTFIHFNDIAGVPPAIGSEADLVVENAKLTPAIAYRLITDLPADTRPVVDVILALGQSLSIGSTGDQALTLPHGDGQVRMLNGGVRVIRGDYDTSAVVEPGQIAALVRAAGKSEGGGPPHGARYGETHLEAMSYKLVAQLGIRTVIAALGVGGTPLAQLGPGTIPFANLTKVANRIAMLVSREGYDVRFSCTIAHGESEEGVGRSAYKEHLGDYMDAVSVLLKGISGQAAVPFFAWQPPALLNPSEVPVAMLELADERDDLFVTSGVYGLPMVDQHMQSVGYHYAGELLAETWREWYNGGALNGRPQPLRIMRAQTGGNLLDVTFANYRINVEVDIGAAVPQIAGWGLDLIDESGSPPTVTDTPPQLVSPGVVRFTLSQPWNAGARRVRSVYRKPAGFFPNPAAYSRSNIRDSYPIASILDNALLYRRLVACDVAVS